jgi:hypothetical protein
MPARVRRCAKAAVSIADVVQKRPFLGYRCRAETAGPGGLDFDSKVVL